jgi:transglutaminase-like putative cysteine protease
MIYDVRHKTTFVYEDFVSLSQHVFHLALRPHPRQRRIRMATRCEPAPTAQSEIEDYFQNPVEFVTIQEPHKRLVVEATSRVEIFEQPRNLSPEANARWEDVARDLSAAGNEVLDAYEFIFDSPYVSSDRSMLNYALPSFSSGRPIVEAVMDLTQRIYRDFEYEGGVSDISTPVDEVLAMRKGVCQDFAHLELACLRSLGLAARYISGYLMTHPPEGRRLQGADASHAWISVWTGRSGWIDFDPTNNLMPGLEHITVAWGRDYGDVSPINGFIVGGGEHKVNVAVDVEASAGNPEPPEP